MQDYDEESRRIMDGRCPACGGDVKDKGSYIRCTVCDWSLTNGEWHDEGYIVMRNTDQQ